MSYLSLNALKVAAEHLKGASSDSDNTTLIEDALLAALRFDRPYPFWVQTRCNISRLDLNTERDNFIEEKIPLKHSVIWLSGSAGAGKGESSHALQLQAMRSGYRAITYDYTREYSERWLPHDRAEIDLSKLCYASMQAREQTEITERVKADIRAKPRYFLAIGTVLEKSSGDSAAAFTCFIDGLLAASPENTVITFRGVDHNISEAPDVQKKLRALAESRNCILIFETAISHTSHKIEIENANFLQGRHYQSDGNLKEYVLRKLDAGEYFLLCGKDWILVSGEHIETGEDEPIMPIEYRHLTALIASELQNSRSASYIDRLDIMARASGYETWEAATDAMTPKSFFVRLAPIFKNVLGRRNSK